LKNLIDTAALQDALDTVLVKAKGQPLGEVLAGQVAAVVMHLAKNVEARLAEFEDGRTMTFEGPHDPGKAYRPGAVVQRGNATWVAMTATTEAPGASDKWRRLGGST
jgi:hypothetical protein